jgi:hypothetical protein
LDPEAVVQRQLEAYNARDLGRFLAEYSPEVRVYRPPASEPAIVGREALAAFYSTQRFNCAGLHAELLNRIVLGNKVIDHERITGLAWEDAIRVELFEPLGLTSGGFGAPTGDQPWGHRGGVALDPAGPVSDNPLALGPAGTAHMTLSDYAKFLGLFITEGGGLLSPETMTVLTRPVREGPTPYAGGWGVALGRPWAQGPALTHDGSNTFWYLSAWVAPGAGRAFVAASNDGVAGGDACRRLIPDLIASN